MKKGAFITMFFLISLSFAFVKIYQHNLVIKLIYEKQRLENRRQNLKKIKNELLVKLYELKEYQTVKKIAQEKMNLQPLAISQITKI